MLAFNLRTWLRLRPTAEELRLHIARWNDAGLGRVKRYEPSALWLAATHAGKLDEVARETYLAAPDDLARFALAVAHEIDDRLPAVEDLGDEAAGRVQRVAAALTAASRPVVIAGIGAGSETLVRAAIWRGYFAGNRRGPGGARGSGADVHRSDVARRPSAGRPAGRRPALPRHARAQPPGARH